MTLVPKEDKAYKTGISTSKNTSASSKQATNDRASNGSERSLNMNSLDYLDNIDINLSNSFLSSAGGDSFRSL